MIPNRFAPIALTLGLVAALIPPALGLEPSAEEVLSKVAARQYLPRESGLKSLSFNIESQMLAMMGMGDAKIEYFWKAPDKERCRISGMDNPMVPKDMMEKQMAGLGTLCVGQSFAEEYEGYSMTVEMDGENYKISGNTDDEEKKASKFTLWVNSDYVPVKQSVTASKPAPMQPPVQELSYKTKMHKDKYYVSEIDQGMSGTLVLNWESVSEVFLPTSLSMKSAMGEMKMSFTEMKVNGDIPEDVFKSAETEVKETAK